MKHLLRTPVTTYTTQALDDYGRKTWTGAVVINGRFRATNKMVMNEQGELTPIDGTCIVDELATNVDVGRKVTIGGVDYRIIKHTDALGDVAQLHHTSLALIRWK
jgi:hypothetical protein